MKKSLCIATLLVLLIPIFVNVAIASSPSITDFHTSKDTVKENEEFDITARVNDADKIFLLKNAENTLPTASAAVLKTKLCLSDTCSATWTRTEQDRVANGADAYFFLVAIGTKEIDASVATYDYFVTHKDKFNYEVRSLAITVVPESADPVDNIPPVATIRASKTSGQIPFEVTFTSISSDEDGTITNYRWTIDDEYKSSKASFTHEFDKRGLHKIELIVTDDDGATNSASTHVIANEKVGGTPSGHGGRPGGEWRPGTTEGVGLPFGVLLIENTHITIKPEKLTSLPLAVLNTGSTHGEFSLEMDGASFGEASAKPSELTVGCGQKAASYIYLTPYKGAAGNQYALKINLIHNGEIVDTETIYVEVEAKTDLTVVGLVVLLLAALAGLAGLAYLIYKDLNKKSSQSKLRKYY